MNILLITGKSAIGLELKSRLEEIIDINIIGVPENSIEVLYTLIQNHVDLMIIDNGMKELSARDCCGMVQKLNIQVKLFLLVDTKEEFESVWNPDCFAGFILRKNNPVEIISQILESLYDENSRKNLSNYKLKRGIVYSEN